MTKLAYHYGMQVRCYPSSRQKNIIKRNSDASRFVYNKMVAIDYEIYRLKQVKLSIDIIQQRINQLQLRRKTTKSLGNQYLFLYHEDIDSLCLADARRNYFSAWKNFRETPRVKKPKFHKKSYNWKYQTNAQYSARTNLVSLLDGSVRFVDRHHAKLPKIGTIKTSPVREKIWRMRNVVRVGTVTVTKDNLNCFYLSFQLASSQPFVGTVIFNNKKLGIDLNVENFLTDSNGNIVNNPQYYRRVLNQLSQQKRKLSRRCNRAKKEHRRLSNAHNYQKQRLLVAKIEKKVAHQRINFLQNLSTELVKNHDLLVAEDLRSSNLLKNHALAISVSDAGWRIFLQQLQDKAEMYGKTFITVNPRNTTQTCSTCGYLLTGNNKLTLADRTWQCPQCHIKHARDYNAAKNILAKGLAELG